MGTDHESTEAVRTATRHLVDELRARRLRGEGRIAGIRAAVEQAALRLTGAASARLVLDGNVQPPQPDETGRPAGFTALSVLLPPGLERAGALEVIGLEAPPSDDARAGLELLVCAAGALLDGSSDFEDPEVDPVPLGASDGRLATIAGSEGFYRVLAETLPGGIVIFDYGDRITWASRKAHELFLCGTGTGLEGCCVPDLVAPESRAFVAERRRLLHEEGRPTEPGEVLLLRGDGSTFWGLVSSAPLFEAGGRVQGGVAVVLDVTQRRQAEEALRHREWFLDRMFRANPDAMYVFDLDDQRIVFANRDLGALAGYSREETEALGSDLLPAILHPDDLALYDRRSSRYDERPHEEVHETLFRVRHKDGTWRWLLGRGIVFDETADGRATQVLAVVKDVTAQKETEDSLRDSETFHRTLADTVPVGIAMTDGEERITWSSPAFRELVGVGGEVDVAGSLVTDWIVTGFEGLTVEHRRAPRTPSCLTRPREVRLRRRDGSVLWADLVSAPLFRPGGDFSGAILAVQDTSELRSVNGTLKKAAERLQLLSRRIVEVQEEERRHLARELHDEIGQSLAAILFRMEALLRSPDMVHGEVLAETAEIADRTMRSVRDLSLDLHPSLLDEAGLADTLRWYIDRQVRGPGLAVELEACPSLASLPADLRIACFRIAQSALTNVVRHAKARTVRVEVRTRDGVLELVVHDDGAGFDVAATLPHVSSGTSLGLLAMRERAELLDGAITFESGAGRGTTVTARFPLREPANEEGAA